jgi:hypothetical protein
LITSEVMEVAGKSLELGGEAQNQRLVQRVSTPPASTSRTSDQSVSDPKLIEPICTFGSPQRQRARYHDSAPYRVLVSVTQGLFPITGSGVNSPGQRPPARCRENRAPPGSEASESANPQCGETATERWQLGNGRGRAAPLLGHRDGLRATCKC